MILADELLEHARGKALIGDSGYDGPAAQKLIQTPLGN
jgi:hypothetical protein